MTVPEPVKGTTAKEWAVTVVGIVVLAVYVAAVVYLAWRRSEPLVTWDRLVFLFGGVEAIAFSAAGYFFGKEVNRKRADQAEKKAADVEADAKVDRASKEAAEQQIEGAKGKMSVIIDYMELHSPGGGKGLVATQPPDWNWLLESARKVLQ